MTSLQYRKFQYVVEDPFYSPTYDSEVRVDDYCTITDTRTGDVLGLVDEHNIDDLYREWFEFTSQDWDTSFSVPDPYAD